MRVNELTTASKYGSTKRELLVLEQSIRIEYPNYDGPMPSESDTEDTPVKQVFILCHSVLIFNLRMLGVFRLLDETLSPRGVDEYRSTFI